MDRIDKLTVNSADIIDHTAPMSALLLGFTVFLLQKLI